MPKSSRVGRVFKLLSLISLLVLIVYALLLVFGVLNPILHLKYLLLVCSFTFTLIPIGLISSMCKINNLLRVIGYFILSFPFLIIAFGTFSYTVLIENVYPFLGGSIFQIGTTVCLLNGSSNDNGKSVLYRILNVFNFSLFVAVALIAFFEIELILNSIILFFLALLISVLSLVGLFNKKAQ